MTPIERLAGGTRYQFDVDISGDSGTQAASCIPVHVCVGVEHHPCLAVVAGIHGDEYDGIVALQQIAREVSLPCLHGTLIVIPVANPLAFDAAQRRTPHDNVDVNRVFPGRADGTVSERLAHILCTQLLQQADLIFTLHGSRADGALSPWVEFLDVFGPLGQASYDAARASGFSDLIALPEMPGVLLTAMAELGVPLIEGEVGGRGTIRRENVAFYKECVWAIARHVGVLSARDEPKLMDRDLRVWHLHDVAAGASGLLLRQVDLKQEVRQGDRLATILDVRGDHAGEIHAPVNGVVGGYRVQAGVQAEDTVFTLWSPATPQVYQRV